LPCPKRFFIFDFAERLKLQETKTKKVHNRVALDGQIAEVEQRVQVCRHRTGLGHTCTGSSTERCLASSPAWWDDVTTTTAPQDRPVWLRFNVLQEEKQQKKVEHQQQEKELEDWHKSQQERKVEQQHVMERLKVRSERGASEV